MIGSGDAVILDDGAMAASSAALLSASGPFSASDVGKTVGVIGTGASGATLISTISDFPSSMVVGQAQRTTDTGTQLSLTI
jgi:cation diffusion facilitator CzcD-associated flavoprotein CzcO